MILNIGITLCTECGEDDHPREASYLTTVVFNVFCCLVATFVFK